MTELEDECAIAMKTDTSNKFLLAGDTAGFIAIFDIKNYCISDEVVTSYLQDHSSYNTWLCLPL